MSKWDDTDLKEAIEKILEEALIELVDKIMAEIKESKHE